MMKHPSRKNDELQKSRDQVRCLCRKFKEQEKDEPWDKLSFDKLVRNDEHLIQDVPWELGGIPNIQDDDMGEAKVKLSIAKALSLPKTILKYKRKPQMTDEVSDPWGKGTKFKKLKTEDLCPLTWTLWIFIKGKKLYLYLGMPNFSGILECIFQVTCLLDLECIVRDHNEELGLYVGRIAPHILHCSFYMILHYENHTRISTTGTMEIGEGITLRSNKTSSCGWSYDYSKFYMKKKYEELTEFYTLRVFLILTDCGNLVSKCQVQVIVGLRPPTGLGKIWKNVYNACGSVADL